MRQQLPAFIFHTSKKGNIPVSQAVGSYRWMKPVYDHTYAFVITPTIDTGHSDRRQTTTVHYLTHGPPALDYSLSEISVRPDIFRFGGRRGGR
jgi:hypothetical protein